MSIGVPYDLYWYGDPWAIRAFREADRLKQQRENEHAWLQGMYVYDALGRLAPLFQAFPKKGTKARDYIKEPYPIGKQRTEDEQAQIAENERLKSILYFRNWARATAKSFGEGR